jgi:hypothetical protein
MCPHDSLDWLYYEYFPEALRRDLADFWPPEAIVAEMTAAGFADVVVDRDHRRNDRNLATFLEGLRRRDRNSQLLTLSDTAYEAGLRRLESELADPSAPRSRAIICVSSPFAATSGWTELKQEQTITSRLRFESARPALTVAASGARPRLRQGERLNVLVEVRVIETIAVVVQPAS